MNVRCKCNQLKLINALHENVRWKRNVRSSERYFTVQLCIIFRHQNFECKLNRNKSSKSNRYWAHHIDVYVFNVCSREGVSISAFRCLSVWRREEKKMLIAIVLLSWKWCLRNSFVVVAERQRRGSPCLMWPMQCAYTAYGLVSAKNNCVIVCRHFRVLIFRYSRATEAAAAAATHKKCAEVKKEQSFAYGAYQSLIDGFYTIARGISTIEMVCTIISCTTEQTASVDIWMRTQWNVCEHEIYR